MSHAGRAQPKASTPPTIPEARPDASPALLAAGLASAAIYLYAGLAMPIGNGWFWVGRFLAAFGGAALLAGWIWLRLRRAPDDRRTLGRVLGFAILFRLLLLPAGWAGPDPATALARDLGGERQGFGKFLLYDNDVWRFVWDGHLAARGFSPYAFAPNAVEENDALAAALLDEELWWDVYDNVGFRGLVTVYPPLAQVWFRAAYSLAPGSVLALKLGPVAADVAICFLLAAILGRLGLRRADVVLYAWNPLVLAQVAGSGHYEPLMVLPLLAGVDWAARRRGALASSAIALAALFKLAPLAVAPVLARRVGLRQALVGVALLVAGGALYWGTISGWLETMAVYNRAWHYNSGIWALVGAALSLGGVAEPGRVAAALCRLAALAVMVWVWRRDDGSEGAAFDAALVILGALVLLSPAVMPWYTIWALPFAVVAGFAPWALLSVLSLLSYVFYVDQTEHLWWRVVEYGGFALAWYGHWKGRRHHGGSATPAAANRSAGADVGFGEGRGGVAPPDPPERGACRGGSPVPEEGDR